jgi:hypothetical protein
MKSRGKRLKKRRAISQLGVITKASSMVLQKDIE